LAEAEVAVVFRVTFTVSTDLTLTLAAETPGAKATKNANAKTNANSNPRFLDAAIGKKLYRATLLNTLF
jgi:hypothetical protein